MTCSVQPSADGSDSGLAMKWRAADNTVVEDGMTGEREIVLNLGTFEESEQGAYTCTACNVRGSGSPVTVHVYGKEAWREEGVNVCVLLDKYHQIIRTISFTLKTLLYKGCFTSFQRSNLLQVVCIPLPSPTPYFAL